MRKVLAQASVGPEHKELVLKDLKSIFKRIKIPLDILLQDENYQQEPTNSQPLFKSYPYITLTIPNYEQHREYLEKVYKSNVLFSKFILLISKGDSYEDLIKFRNEEILRQHCRNWNNSVSCTFDSAPVFTDLQEQMGRVDQILGGMDIRGKISQIDAQKKFHLIEDHWPKVDDPHPDVKPPGKKTLLKLFFGLELGRSGRSARAGGITIAADSRYSCSSEFVEYEEETADEADMCDDNQMGIIQEKKILGFGGFEGEGVQQKERVLRGERVALQKVKINAEKRQAKRRSQQVLADKNPYLKKQYPCEVVLSQSAMVEE